MATNLDTTTAHIDARSHHTNELPILERANDVDDVVRNLNQIIDWAMAEQSTIGYFAVLYKRSTMAIREAIDGDLFKNSARMAAFDVVFAQRYFDALNAFFHPDEFPDLNLAWEVAFVGHANPETTMLQQMLAEKTPTVRTPALHVPKTLRNPGVAERRIVGRAGPQRSPSTSWAAAI